MNKQEFSNLSDTCLAHVASWLECFDPDEVDFATTDGVVTLEFPGKTRYVLNRQAAANQMWFAADARAWHYDWDETKQTWVDDRDGHLLYEKLGEVVSQKIGRTVAVEPR